jgi:hypothetical protein
MAVYPPHPATELSTTDGHVDGFGELFQGLTTRWIKVERLQHYDESDSPGYRAFLRGDHDQAARLVEELVRGQTDFYEFARSRGIQLIRIRIYDLPLSPYLEHYEFVSYRVSAECGEEIRFVDARMVSDLLESTGLSDYLLFDDRAVVALVYDTSTGRLRRALRSDEPDVIETYRDISEELIRRSVPMRDAAVALGAQ